MNTAMNGFDPGAWHYSPSGLLVYFRRRPNNNYDAVDAQTHKRLQQYTNLTLNRIRKLFQPYKQERPDRPLLRQAAADLGRFEVDLERITAPADEELHRAVSKFATRTRHDLEKMCE